MEPGAFVFLLYTHVDATATVWVGGPTLEKSLGFDFWNDRLIAYNFVSSFQADSTNFDEGKLKQADGGEVTKEEVIRRLGEPTGRAIYPAVRTRGDEKFIYHYSEADHKKRQRSIKRLEVLFDAEGRMRDFAFVSEDRELAPLAPSGGTYVPIFIPRGK